MGMTQTNAALDVAECNSGETTMQQRLLAWAHLKSQRGQTVVQHRIIAMQRAAQ